MSSGPWSATTRILFGLMVVAWAVNVLFVRVGLQYTSALWLASMRAGIATAGVFALIAVRRGAPRLDGRDRRDAMILGIPNTAVVFGLWLLAAANVPAGQASVVIYSFPVWVALQAALLLHRRLTPTHWAAVALGFGGVILISQPGAPGSTPATILSLGELVTAAVSWALATILFQRRFRPDQLPEANGYQLLGGTVTLMVASLLFLPSHPPGPVPALWLSALWLGLVGGAFAYTVWFFLLGRVEASDLSAYAYLVPVAALALSAAFLGERLNPLQGAGVALVLSSTVLVSRASVDRARLPDRS